MIKITLWFKLLLIGLVSGQMIFPGDPILRKNYVKYVESLSEESNIEDGYYSSPQPENIFGDNYIGRGVNDFSLRINKALLNGLDEGHEENIVLSPLSITGALSLLVLGSVGKTYEELSQALGFFNDIKRSRTVHDDFAAILNKIARKDRQYIDENESNQNISYGSSIFLQKDFPIRPQYEGAVKNIYKSDIQRVNFESNGLEAQRIINKWVSDLTHGKIQNIVNMVPPFDTRMIITSALYFRAEWEKYFFDGLTKKLSFTPDKRYPNKTIMVDMMANEGKFPFFKSIEHECMIVGLPYRGNKTTLYAIKPLSTSNKSLKQLLKEMNTETLEYLIKSTTRQSTIVLFPKMKLTATYNLKSVFQSMGVHAVFSKTESNLALISPNNKIPFLPSYNSADNDRLVFTRFGNDNCIEILNSNNTAVNNCTTTEEVDGRKVKVVYKKIGDKIGRKIEKRSTKKITKRQSLDLWNPGLYVDDVVHKVDIGITETGTEAAAATNVFITRDGRRPVFRADEPFFFIIRDEESTLPLFTSIIFKPLPNYV